VSPFADTAVSFCSHHDIKSFNGRPADRPRSQTQVRYRLTCPARNRREQNSKFSSYSVVMSTIVPCFSASTIPAGFPNSPGAVDQYRNQYQTASDRYIPIPTYTLRFQNKLCQNGSENGPSGAIPTLASISNARNEKELATGGRATVSETVSKLAPYIILARIRQNSLKLAHYGVTLQCRTGTRFMTCKL
jgi:hypothetical protein